ncbi:hypothetical protein [Spirochaeta lutea]|uniref:DUF2232 domain-containing protein n=1 Tax=Spirochaeta lutea TaxID=1480694 RepID=A0A098R500_9SPIO|nr:hypothetical protein [Spirochaeta lutea]KGE73802.1 hypothetical protein DC28_00850 [Spirochaeta lutea]
MANQHGQNFWHSLGQQPWLHVLGMGMASVLLYSVGFTMGIFLIPLQLVHERWGLGNLLYGAGLVLVSLFLLLEYDLARSIDADTTASLMRLTMLMPAAMVGGLVLLNSTRRKLHWTVSLGVLQVAGAVILAPLMVRFLREGPFLEFIGLLVEGLFETGGGGQGTEDLIRFLGNAMVRTYALGNTVMVLGGFFLGRLVSSRDYRKSWGIGFSRYQVNRVWLWIFIVSGFLGLIDLRFNPGLVFGLVVWTILSCAGFIYGVQGLAILWAWLINRRGGLAPKGGLAVLVLVGMIIPGVNLVISLGLPLLGLSETWITYTFRVKERKAHEGNFK